MDKIALKPGVTLQAHQNDVLEKLKETDALLLFHGLGSGKTLSSIAATEGDDVTVVAPASLRSNYKKELNKFVASPKDRDKYNVISYEGALAGKEGFGDTLVVDEIHRIANADSGRSKKIVEMADHYGKRIGLTGTPLVNHPSEMVPILRFLNPEDTSIPTNRSEFNNRFIGRRTIPVGWINKVRGFDDGIKNVVINQDQIRQAIGGKIHYHDMDQKDYPTVDEEVVKVPMSRGQENVYKTVTNKADPIIAAKVRKNMPLSTSEMRNMNFFLQAARQSSNNDGRYGGSGVTPKIEKIVDDFVDEIENKKDFKGVIYSNYIESGLDQIGKLLSDNDVKYERFTGGMNDKQKASVVDKYNAGKTNALLVSSAGAEGLDLKGTNMVQISEPHWNKAKIDQVIGRAARYKSHAHLPEGQRNVKVKKYQSVVKRGTSADEYLEQMSIDKDKLNQVFLDIFKEEGKK